MAKYEKWLTPDGLVRIGGWARDGLTDEQIAHNMGISRSTLNAWKKKVFGHFGHHRKRQGCCRPAS